jgi:acyl-CoA reductase-like NAD-dependent aldehyde dehydrogenase
MCFWALASAFHKAGLPGGCLNTIYHRSGPDAAIVTEALIAHPAIKKVNFTGSTNTGAIIAGMSGKYLKPVLMELGGKASSIVFEDAELQSTAINCAIGAFAHSGQICMSTERILVHKSIVSGFREVLETTMNHMFGPGEDGKQQDAPILVAELGVSKNKKLLDNAISKGARAIWGDAGAHETSSTRMRPVIIEGVKKEMDIFYTESFGPTVALYTFDTEEEAIELANDTDYGLSCAVFTEDLRRGLRVAKQIESGAVHINGPTVHDESALPHGGVKKSGWGRFNAREGLEEWVKTKTITWKD